MIVRKLKKTFFFFWKTLISQHSKRIDFSINKTALNIRSKVTQNKLIQTYNIQVHVIASFLLYRNN